MEEGKSAVVVLSGGADSVTTLYYAVLSGYDVSCLNFDYGQNHFVMESREARWHCQEHEIPLTVVDLRSVQSLLDSALTGYSSVPEVPETEEHYETLKQTVVPNRNAIMLSVAYGYAITKKANRVFYGAHASDYGVYPDCRQEFVDKLNQALQAGNWSKRDDKALPVIIAPFINYDKKSIIKWGHHNSVDYRHSYSCYKGGDTHCGVCSSCLERKRAFREAGVVDPTQYEVVV